MSDSTFDKAALDRWITGTSYEQPDDEWADDEDDGPDPDDVRDRQIERETERAMNSFEQEREE